MKAEAGIVYENLRLGAQEYDCCGQQPEMLQGLRNRNHGPMSIPTTSNNFYLFNIELQSDTVSESRGIEIFLIFSRSFVILWAGISLFEGKGRYGNILYFFV